VSDCKPHAARHARHSNRHAQSSTAAALSCELMGLTLHESPRCDRSHNCAEARSPFGSFPACAHDCFKSDFDVLSTSNILSQSQEGSMPMGVLIHCRQGCTSPLGRLLTGNTLTATRSSRNCALYTVPKLPFPRMKGVPSSLWNSLSSCSATVPCARAGTRLRW
jgi:hypothetical protein